MLRPNFAETGVQVPSDGVVRPLHMLFYRSLHRNQSSKNKAADWGCLWGSMEKDIPNVICVLHKHCAGECEPAVHPSLLHADHKVFHSCNDRLVSFTMIYLVILYFPVLHFVQNDDSFWPKQSLPLRRDAVILQWLVWRKYFEWRIWASLVPIVGGILLTSVTELSFNTFGFCAAMVGCLATSTKTILAESLLHGYKFDRYSIGYCK